MSQNLNRFFRIYLRLAALTLVVCTLLRIVLLFNEQTSELGFGFLQWVAVFGLGALNDLCALTLGYVFLWLFLLTLSKRKYDRNSHYCTKRQQKTAVIQHVWIIPDKHHCCCT